LTAPHVPTEKTRKTVKKLCRVGYPQEDVAKVLKIAPKTLRKYYEDEIELSSLIATGKVANVLYKLCMEGNLSAVTFWMKTRGKWRESDNKDIKEEAMILLAAVRAGAKMSDEAWEDKMVRKSGG